MCLTAVILSSTVIFALRASCGFTLTSAESRNITLTKSKYNLRSKYNRFALARCVPSAHYGEFMSLQGIANGDAVAISRKGHLIMSLHNDFLIFFGFLELLFPQNVQYHADRRRNYVGYRLAGDYAVNGNQHVQKIHQRNVHNALSYY